ncbi:glycosyltransferase [Clostridium perfringens]|uniref:glycosyltransferase n=1 Tax=Clostridium perfringens TaxID=1502 RepID=UPI000E186FE2|nr:glycosyltransferase [Clostridium perfringens]MDM0500688.1 glycosyltransferase [Clostridium perfringens]MDM0703846.1 glycosyltransferase [Clostridium perfringens]SUY38071.1 capsular polysaccharide biosynthesis protein [Clostridium perfringens]
MKRCLHILPMNKLSGAEKMALLICKNMKEYEPVVVCGGNNLKEVFKKNGIKSYSLKFSSKKILSTLNGLKKIIKENDIKILHAHDNNASLNAYLVKKLYRLDVKVISHIHNCYPWLKGNNFNKKIDKFLRPRYDYNITCGKIVYDFYKENTNYFEERKTLILSNAMDIEEITKVDLSKSEEVIKEFNIPRDKTILGFIGRLDEQKGIIPFIEEFAKHKEDFSDCRILIVGNGSQEYEVKNLIRELGLEDLVILVGFQSDIYKFYPIIDIFFLPSLYEGLPMVLLEAMAFKKAVVSMNVGSISEVILDGYTGILIKNKDYVKFIDNLINIKNDLIMRERYEKNSFDFIKNKYNINQYIIKLEKIYYDIIGCDLYE